MAGKASSPANILCLLSVLAALAALAGNVCSRFFPSVRNWLIVGVSVAMVICIVLIVLSHTVSATPRPDGTGTGPDASVATETAHTCFSAILEACGQFLGSS